jgi:hypothetical protein
MNTTSVRLPDPLRDRVRARALTERRSISNTIRVLIEAGLDASRVPPESKAVDKAEVERLAGIARDALTEQERSAA